VRKCIEQYIRRREKLQKEQERLAKMWEFENKARTKGYRFIAGVDEAGRGPLAGPVVAAAVILPEDFDVTGLNDSKQLTVEERLALRQRIEADAIAIGIGIVDAEEIDRINILQATYQAMRLAIAQLSPAPDYILADAVTIPGISISQEGIIKGDARSHSIAAASIIAKTTRDALMIEYGKKYPEYGFEKHMGYSTPEHLSAIERHGPCPIHRKSFAPIKTMLEVASSKLDA
jgi:ribonuclease HII